MNRKILLQVTAPAVVIGLLLFGTCLASAWYINRLQSNMARILADNVASLQAAQELEISVRQLRFHGFLYLIDQRPERLGRIEEDHRNFERALLSARQASDRPEERMCVQEIETGYRQYHDELAQIVNQVGSGRRPANLGQLADSHPILHVVAPCKKLLDHNNVAMEKAAQENNRLGREVRGGVLFIGLVGPVGGLVAGYGIARALSRSIYQLSVRVRDVARRLDQNVASVNIVADGDIRNLDHQLQHVLAKVEEVGERLQQHQRDMLRAEQLAAVGQLAASVAHEVRNPLTSVKMLVEAALRPKNQKALTPDDLRIIHGEITRLERTVQNFLDFARLPTPRLAGCDIRDIVTEALKLIEARARQQGVTLTADLPGYSVCAHVDREQLRTVFVNLFLNALDAMPQSGRLSVRLDNGTSKDIRVVVEDTGPGIAAELGDRLFTPFTSTKPTGTGLGLSLSRRIVEEHGGSLSATNLAKGGASFTVSLPDRCNAAATALPAEYRH
jgi:signal transduction histidine kinase